MIQLGDLRARVIDPPRGDGPTVVLLHGFGAPGDDLVPIGHELRASGRIPEGTRFVFPEAPLAPPELMGGRAWWMIDLMEMQLALLTGNLDPMTKRDPEGLTDARHKVLGLLTALDARYSVDRKRLLLGGFSQGAMVSCDVAWSSDEPLGALAILSGTLLAEGRWRSGMPARRGLSILQSHGTADPLLPFAIAEKLRDAMIDAGLEVGWITLPGGHGIAPNVIDALAAQIAAL